MLINTSYEFVAMLGIVVKQAGFNMHLLKIPKHVIATPE